MVVTVEISGILEEKLRRLVELGVYSSVAEAVRDAVRNMIDKMDLVDIALQLYINKDASFQYISYFASKPYKVMIDIMLSQEILPLLGARTGEELRDPEPGTYVIDPFTAFVIYESDIHDILEEKTNSGGYRFLYPEAGKPQLEVYMARRLSRGRRATNIMHIAPIPVPTEPPRHLVTHIEEALVSYAEAAGAILLSDDIRTREYARKRGVEAYSTLSLLKDSIARGIVSFERAVEIIYSVKSIPLLVPDTIIPTR
ncbi:MAG: hypothetical protein GSR84_01475 [Desulfurococcales archaeon]|nr:hypothetical protein [Desulfurococcales archaeon]